MPQAQIDGYNKCRPEMGSKRSYLEIWASRDPKAFGDYAWKTVTQTILQYGCGMCTSTICVHSPCPPYRYVELYYTCSAK